MASTWLTWYFMFVVHMYLSSVAASNTSCPTWFYFNDTTQQCECGNQVRGIQCNQQEEKVEIRHGHCVMYSGQNGLYYAGLCPFVPTKNNTSRMSSVLPTDPDLLNDAMCGPYNREGLLCGRCIDGYGPAVFSFDRKCADCSEHSTGYAITLYLSLKFIPITLFFMCVLIFRINITSGLLLGYVIFCQLNNIYLQSELYLYEYINSLVSKPTKSLFLSSLTLSDLWIMQYFRFVVPPLCLSTQLTSIHIQLLPLATDIYPVVLVFITCILMELHARNYRIIHVLWKPISIPLKKLNIQSVSSGAIIHTLATFLLLSAFSLSYTLYNLCVKSSVHRSTNGTIYKTVLYYDSTITWFSSNHIPYIATALSVAIFLLFIPSLLLCVYPTRIYGYLSQYISIRKRLAITAFVEALQNCFKDGLNGTRDYRALSALFLIGAATGALVDYILKLIFTAYSTDIVCSLVYVMSSFSISYLRPCKLTIANLSLSYHAMMLAILSAAMHLWKYELHTDTAQLKWIFITVPVMSHVLVLMWAGYTLTHWIMSHFRYPSDCKVTLTDLANALKRHFHKRRDTYQVLPDTASQ